MVNSSDPHSFIESLNKAAKTGWSGVLRALQDGRQAGAVVMHDGLVAWAVSSSLAEDFSSVLERVGHVSRDKLAAAKHAVQNHRDPGKPMSLGTLLVEECLISPSVLRTCFKTHVTAALDSLVKLPRLSLQHVDERLSVDASLLFRLNEVLPSPRKGSHSRRAPVSEALAGGAAAESELLEGLVLLPGYRYSFVADMAGNLVACHMADEVNVQVERTIPKALSWLSAACTISTETEMGTVESAFLQGESGSLFAQMTDEQKRFFVAVSFGSAGKLGVIKHKIAELIPAVRRFTEVL